jgi:hypothetical protein
MFGRGVRGTGVIIEPAVPVDLSAEVSRAEFINDIWPSIDSANQSSPTHSRIFKELVIIADAINKPFPRTPKSTTKRKATLKLYEKEIEQAYELYSTPADLQKVVIPEEWNSESLFRYVQAVVQSIMRSGQLGGSPIYPDRDLFEQGCDRYALLYQYSYVYLY